MLPSGVRLSSSCRRVGRVLTHLSRNMSTNVHDAGIIVIGDEILKGHVHDTNSHFLSKKLFSLGVRVKKISVVPDDLDTIAEEVKLFSSMYTHVITSGGVGPTHDDMTFEGVAKAFGEKVHPHPELVALCKKYFGTDDLRSPKLKLAMVPESAKLVYGIDRNTGKPSLYPLVNVKNVYLFPGVPSLLERAFDRLEDLLRNPSSTFHLREVYLNTDEVSIAGILNEVNAKFTGHVTLGSYPDFHNSYYRVKLTLEAEDHEKLEAAHTYLMNSLPEGAVVEYDSDPVSMGPERLYKFLSSSDSHPIKEQVQHAVSIIEEAFDRYKLEEICIGFNGGKDCTALLHLAHSVYRMKYPETAQKLKSLYIRRGQPFPELELFIQKSTQAYRLDIINIHGRIRDSLATLQKQHPEIKAVLMGTRQTDPYSSHLQNFSMTDPDWPQFMRVNPILSWSYSDVWAFLRKFNLPYCSLYDRGYTSLGSMENTHPNPELQEIDSRGSVTYRPAYLLVDQHSERAGRN